MVSNTVDDCLRRQIDRKILKSKFQAFTVNAGLYMAFKHCISFATDLAANFGCDPIRIMPDITSKLCAQLSEIAVQFNSHLSRRRFLGQVVYLDPLI